MELNFKLMYYIYHIPGVKIGCTNNLNRRIREQGFDYYEILETHFNKSIASEREIELQKQYGYNIDNLNYTESIRRITKAQQISLETKDKWLPNIDWKAREAKIDKDSKWKKVKSSRNYINMDRSAIGFKCQAKRKKILLQYDLNGKFIKEWSCGINEMKKTEYPNAVFAARLNSKSKTMYGYIWKFKQ